MKIVKKSAEGKYTIQVSTTNFNRVKFGARTTAAVLMLEGYDVKNGSVYLDGEVVLLSNVVLAERAKSVIKLDAKTPEPS